MRTRCRPKASRLRRIPEKTANPAATHGRVPQPSSFSPPVSERRRDIRQRSGNRRCSVSSPFDAYRRQDGEPAGDRPERSRRTSCIAFRRTSAAGRSDIPPDCDTSRNEDCILSGTQLCEFPGRPRWKTFPHQKFVPCNPLLSSPHEPILARKKGQYIPQYCPKVPVSYSLFRTITKIASQICPEYSRSFRGIS